MLELINYDNDRKLEVSLYELNSLTLNKGLSLSRKDIKELINTKNEVLKYTGRVEVQPIIEEIVFEFYNSYYIDKDNYKEVINELIRIYYMYTSYFDNRLTSEEIIKYMSKEFNGRCNGEIVLLETVSFEELKDDISKGKYYEY